MTGFGRGTAVRDGNRVTVELSAVNNRKQTDLRFSLPRELSALEPILRNRLQEAISRGSLNINLSYELNPTQRRNRVRLDRDLAAGTIQALQELARETGISAEVRIGEILLVPGVITEELAAPLQCLTGLAIEALDTAVAELRQMQAMEGSALQRDLVERHQQLARLLESIQGKADEILRHYQHRLHERIRQLGVEIAVSDERLAREVAFLAERSDIAEEVVRLDSHLKQLKELISSTEPTGRMLDFLCLEMNREISTVCAKTCDTTTADLALAFKAELGRMREQMQNVV